jgi:hypothetical protein
MHVFSSFYFFYNVTNTLLSHPTHFIILIYLPECGRHVTSRSHLNYPTLILPKLNMSLVSCEISSNLTQLMITYIIVPMSRLTTINTLNVISGDMGICQESHKLQRIDSPCLQYGQLFKGIWQYIFLLFLVKNF